MRDREAKILAQSELKKKNKEMPTVSRLDILTLLRIALVLSCILIFISM